MQRRSICACPFPGDSGQQRGLSDFIRYWICGLSASYTSRRNSRGQRSGHHSGSRRFSSWIAATVLRLYALKPGFLRDRASNLKSRSCDPIQWKSHRGCVDHILLTVLKSAEIIATRRVRYDAGTKQVFHHNFLPPSPSHNFTNNGRWSFLQMVKQHLHRVFRLRSREDPNLDCCFVYLIVAI